VLRDKIEEKEKILPARQRLLFQNKNNYKIWKMTKILSTMPVISTVWLQSYHCVKDPRGNDKYKLKHKLGTGTSSRISAAEDIITGNNVAIKIIKLKNRFKLTPSMNRNDQMYKRMYREIQLLKHFKEHMNKPENILLELNMTTMVEHVHDWNLNMTAI